MVYIEDITRWREDMNIIFEWLFSTRENNIHIFKLYYMVRSRNKRAENI